MAGAVTCRLYCWYGRLQHSAPLGQAAAEHEAPRLMAAKFVLALRKSKSARNHHNDAEAISTEVGHRRCVLRQSF